MIFWWCSLERARSSAQEIVFRHRGRSDGFHVTPSPLYFIFYFFIFIIVYVFYCPVLVCHYCCRYCCELVGNLNGKSLKFLLLLPGSLNYRLWSFFTGFFGVEKFQLFLQWIYNFFLAFIIRNFEAKFAGRSVKLDMVGSCVQYSHLTHCCNR